MKAPILPLATNSSVLATNTSDDKGTKFELLPAEEVKTASIDMPQSVGVVKIPFDTDAVDAAIRGVLDDIATTNPEKLKYIKRITWQQPYQIVILPPKIDFELN